MSLIPSSNCRGVDKPMESIEGYLTTLFNSPGVYTKKLNNRNHSIRFINSRTCLMKYFRKKKIVWGLMMTEQGVGCPTGRHFIGISIRRPSATNNLTPERVFSNGLKYRIPSLLLLPPEGRTHDNSPSI